MSHGCYRSSSLDESLPEFYVGIKWMRRSLNKGKYFFYDSPADAMTHLMESMDVENDVCSWFSNMDDYSDEQKHDYAKVKKIYAVLVGDDQVVCHRDNQDAAQIMAQKLNKSVEKLKNVQPGVFVSTDDYLLRC